MSAAIARPALIAALLLALTGHTWAANNKVFRCTGANGKVTLSDRRCPEDDVERNSKADAGTAKPAAAPASAGADSRVCLDAKERLAERRRQKTTSDAARKALKSAEDEQRRACGA